MKVLLFVVSGVAVALAVFCGLMVWAGVNGWLDPVCTV